MGTIFAKFIFAAAAVFSGYDQDLPPTVRATPEVPEVRHVLAVLGPPPCAPGFVCPPGAPAVYQRFCLAPGAFTVTARLGLIAQTPLAGKVWIETAAGPSLLAAFAAAPGSPAYVAASLPISSSGECVRVRVDASDAVEVIADPGVSFLVFSR